MRLNDFPILTLITFRNATTSSVQHMEKTCARLLILYVLFFLFALNGICVKLFALIGICVKFSRFIC